MAQRLPLLAPEALQSTSIMKAPQHLNRRILVADDDLELRAGVCEQFSTIYDNIKIPPEALPIEDMFLFACGHDVYFGGSLGHMR